MQQNNGMRKTRYEDVVTFGTKFKHLTRVLTFGLAGSEQQVFG